MSSVDTCPATIHGFWAHPGVQTACGRPDGHDGIHWPVPLAGDKEKQE